MTRLYQSLSMSVPKGCHLRTHLIRHGLNSPPQAQCHHAFVCQLRLNFDPREGPVNICEAWTY